jgi:hypothetical protein
MMLSSRCLDKTSIEDSFLQFRAKLGGWADVYVFAGDDL